MSTVAILGAGAGGAAAAVELTQAGHRVRLWNRRQTTLAPFAALGAVRHVGLLGDGITTLEAVTADLDAALAGADGAVLCLPALAHETVAAELAAAHVRIPVVLNPGHTGGALHVAAVIRAAGPPPPPLAELSTLTYVARKPEPDLVRVTGRAGRVWAACLPGGEDALDLARELFPAASAQADVLATSLANVNLSLHPPAAVLGAAWVEATGGDFRFYADATTPAVARVMATLDAERLAVARAFGHRLDPLLAEMAAIGTVERAAAATGDLGAAIAGGAANASIRAPASLAHRYYTEDFPYGIIPFLELARIAGVAVPMASALLAVADAACGGTLVAGGLTARRLGIDGLDRDGLVARVHVPTSVGGLE